MNILMLIEIEARTKNLRKEAAAAVGISAAQLAAWTGGFKDIDFLKPGAFAAAQQKVGISAEKSAAWSEKMRELKAQASVGLVGRVLHIDYNTPKVIVDAARVAGIPLSAINNHIPTKTNYEMSPGRAARFQYLVPPWPLLGDVNPPSVDSRPAPGPVGI